MKTSRAGKPLSSVDHYIAAEQTWLQQNEHSVDPLLVFTASHPILATSSGDLILIPVSNHTSLGCLVKKFGQPGFAFRLPIGERMRKHEDQSEQARSNSL